MTLAQLPPPFTFAQPARPASRPGAGHLAASVNNLLSNCAGVSAGQSLLVVVEPDDSFYKDSVGQRFASFALQRGLCVTVVAEPLVAGPEKFPLNLLARIAQADHTVFFSRLGTQARFLNFPGHGTKIVAYTLDAASLASPFASLPYAFLQAVHDRLVKKISASSSYRITCAKGTDLRAELQPGSASQAAVLTPFTVRNFPLMIVPPISAQSLTGTLALSLAILSTSTHDYPDPTLPLDSPLLLQIKQGRISRFDGEPGQAARARQHFLRVAEEGKGDPYSVNSWHTGFNPGTHFAGRAQDDLSRWGNVAFGSPRYTHFHMVGSDPGEVCGSLFDATISFDGEVLWRDGRLAWLRSAEAEGLARHHGVPLALLDMSPSIGIGNS
jgi:hypothetical protein